MFKLSFCVEGFQDENKHIFLSSVGESDLHLALSTKLHRLVELVIFEKFSQKLFGLKLVPLTKNDLNSRRIFLHYFDPGFIN